MKKVKWIDTENYSHYSNKDWICNIFFNKNLWHWEVIHENSLLDCMDQRIYCGDTVTKKSAKLVCEEFLKNSCC